jgi:hypothetical protein
MPSGGYRPGAGFVGTRKHRHKRQQRSALSPADYAELTPLQWMLHVMNDPKCDPAIRDRMAIQAAPYCHARSGEKRQPIPLQKAAFLED